MAWQVIWLVFESGRGHRRSQGPSSSQAPQEPVGPMLDSSLLIADERQNPTS